MLSVVDLCREPELAALHVEIPRHDGIIQHRARRPAGAAVGPRPHPGHDRADAGQRGEPPPVLGAASRAARGAATGRGRRGQIRPPLFPGGGAQDRAPLAGHVALPEVVALAAVPHGPADGGHVPQLGRRQLGENAVDCQLREVEHRGLTGALGALHLGRRALPLEGLHERHGVGGRGRGGDAPEQPVAGQESEQREREFLADGGEEQSHVTGAWLGQEEEAGEDEGGDQGKHRSESENARGALRLPSAPRLADKQQDEEEPPRSPSGKKKERKERCCCRRYDHNRIKNLPFG